MQKKQTPAKRTSLVLDSRDLRGAAGGWRSKIVEMNGVIEMNGLVSRIVEMN